MISYVCYMISYMMYQYDIIHTFHMKYNWKSYMILHIYLISYMISYMISYACDIM